MAGGKKAMRWEECEKLRAEARARCFPPAGVPPLQPENISSPFPRPEAAVPLRATRLRDPTRLPGVRSCAHLKGTVRDVNLIPKQPNRLAGTLACCLFDCRLVVAAITHTHTRVAGFVYSQTSDE